LDVKQIYFAIGRLDSMDFPPVARIGNHVFENVDGRDSICRFTRLKPKPEVAGKLAHKFFAMAASSEPSQDYAGDASGDYRYGEKRAVVLWPKCCRTAKADA
jgi:hypothetical protein